MKFSKSCPRIRIGVYKVFYKGSINTDWVGKISPQYNFYFMIFSTFVSITASDPGLWIMLVMSSNSRIKVILDQEDYK